MANTLKFGNGEWYGKEGTILAYNSENNNYKPLPFNFERSSTATRVNKQGLIETVGADQPRIDYLNDSNGALLLEPSRSNYLPNRDNGSNYTTFSATKTLNEVISLDGTLNSFTVEGNGDYNQVLGESVSVTLPSAGDYTFSVFAKKGNNNFIQLFFNQFTGSSNGDAYFDLENGTTSSSFGRIENYGNGWYKCSVVGTVVSGDLTGKFGFRVSYSSTNFFFPTANDAIGKNAHFYGFQAEQGSYATSYIPTQGSAVTRLADVCSQTVPDGVIGQTEGTLFLEVAALTNTPSNDYITISDGTNNNFVGISFYTGTNRIIIDYIGGGVPVYSAQTLSDITLFNKIAINYNGTSLKVFINGNNVFSSSVNSFNASLNTLLFSYPTTYNNFIGKTNQIQVFTEALSDEELQKLTTI